MYKLVLCCLLIGSVVSQNRVPPPGLPAQQYPTVTGWNPADPNHPCNQPGVNCNLNSRFAEESSYIDHRGNRERYTRVCDDRGCYERRVSNGQRALSTSIFMLMAIAFVATSIKSLLF
jgi:hypothetical protein